MVNKCYKKTKKSFKRKEEKGTKISLKKKKKNISILVIEIIF